MHTTTSFAQTEKSPLFGVIEWKTPIKVIDDRLLLIFLCLTSHDDIEASSLNIFYFKEDLLSMFI